MKYTITDVERTYKYIKKIKLIADFKGKFQPFYLKIFDFKQMMFF